MLAGALPQDAALGADHPQARLCRHHDGSLPQRRDSHRRSRRLDFQQRRRGLSNQMKISYNWLNELAEITLKPQELAERLTMVGLAVESVERHGDDHLLDIDLTSNRPDALSHLGVAREAAILCGTALKPRVMNLTESDEAVESA